MTALYENDLNMPKTGQDLAGHVKARRVELGLGPSDAARLAGVTRQAWAAWETGTVPYDKNWVVIERVLQWERGSIEATLAGGKPTPTQRRPRSSPDSDPRVLAEELGLPLEQVLAWFAKGFNPGDRQLLIEVHRLDRQRHQQADQQVARERDRQRPRGA